MANESTRLANPVRKRVSLQASLRLFAKKLLNRFHIDIRIIHDGHQQSETSYSRSRLLPYCIGNGLDLGPGGDPISPSAVRIDLPTPYHYGEDLLPVQLSGSADNLYWFKDACLDYIYSSHLLEDFVDSESVLREWLRVLKPGGRLILYCPDEQVYRSYCKKVGQPYNYHHVHADFCLDKVKRILAEIAPLHFVYEQKLVDDYSWELVAEKPCPTA